MRSISSAEIGCVGSMQIGGSGRSAGVFGSSLGHLPAGGDSMRLPGSEILPPDHVEQLDARPLRLYILELPPRRCVVGMPQVVDDPIERLADGAHLIHGVGRSRSGWRIPGRIQIRAEDRLVIEDWH